MGESLFCREVATASGRSIAGTAAYARVWIGVEVRGVWGPRPPADCEIDPALERWVVEVGRRFPHARVQWMRRSTGSEPGSPCMLFVVGSQGVRSRSWTDAGELTVDLDPALTQAEAPDGWRDEKRPQYWVCTHGRRDRCCAKWGVPVYQTLARRAPERVWQTSHLGGHRFAPTLITMPAMVVYGHVEDGEVDALFDATEAGRWFDLARVRGRASVPGPAQVAEVEVRRRTERLDDDAVRSTQWVTDAVADSRTQVIVEVDGDRHEVTVESRGLTLLASCDDEPKTTTQLDVRGHRVLD